MSKRRISKRFIVLALLLTVIAGEGLLSQAIFQQPSSPSVFSRQMPGDSLDTPSRPTRGAAHP